MASRFADKLGQAMQANGLSGYRLSKLTDIPQPAISRFLAGTRNPTADVMERLRKAFNDEMMSELQLARGMDLVDREKIKFGSNVTVNGYANEGGNSGISFKEFEFNIDRMPQRLPVFGDISHRFRNPNDPPNRYEDFPRGIAPDADHAVTFTDESLIDVGFRPGTYLFIKAQQTAKSGQPVIARIDGTDYTCKIYRDNGKKQWLEGRSGAFKDRLYFDQVEIEIMGVIVAYWGRT